MDGRLKDIKQAFKNNEYKIGLQSTDVNRNKAEAILNGFDYKDLEIIQEENQINCNIKLPSADTSKLLNTLSTKGNINHFEEKVPSVNEIFIKAVEENQ